MLIPAYWAEGRLQHRTGRRQVTVRRFGWSDVSLDDAQRQADTRVREAIDAILAGHDLPRRERKTVYNTDGAIREEIVERHGTAVVTRNAYGARCLNVPDVLFADIDFEPRQAPQSVRAAAVIGIAVAAVAIARGMGASVGLTAVCALVAIVVALAATGRRRNATQSDMEVEETEAMARIERFVASHPDWMLRVYRTPAGLRTAALHRRFDPTDAEVARCFDALGVDRVYDRMCMRQRCFRARVSPKPWRIGIAGHLRPTHGVWPIAEARMPERRAWIDSYERRAAGFAACRVMREVGAGGMDADAMRIVELHDAMCSARSDLPIA